MKVLFHSWEFGAGSGGIGQYLYQMACGIRQYGHEAIVVTGYEKGQPEVCETEFGWLHRVYGQGELRHPSVADKVLALAERYQVDWIEGADHLGECAPLLARTGRPPVVIKYHSCQYLHKIRQVSALYFWQVLTIGLASWRIRRQIAAERQCVEQADCAIAPSQRIIDAYREQKSCIPSQIAIIPNMLSRLPEVVDTMEAERPTLLFVGRIEVLKGIEYLPGLIKSLRKFYPNVVLEIAGSDQYARGLGSLQAWLAKQFNEMPGNIRFLGRLTPEQLAQAYRRCWLLVFPSKWDNFPMAVLEAMAHGKPIVATPHGGMAEMLAGTEAPIARPESGEFLDCVYQLLAAKARRRQIGDACRHKVSTTYMPDQVVPLYLHFLEKQLCAR